MAQSVEGLKSAADTTKQIATLSTGIIGLTVTFANEFTGKGGHPLTPLLLQLSWLFLVFSVISAVVTLMAITGSLSKIDQGITMFEDQNLVDANSKNIKLPGVVMLFSFVIGLSLTGIAGSFMVR
jgi:hypothetical protein